MKPVTLFSDLDGKSGNQGISPLKATSKQGPFKSSFHFIPACFAVVFTSIMFGGCAGDQTASKSSSGNLRQGEIAIGSEGLSGLDLGENWERSTTDSTISGSGGTGGEWAIVLFTYTGPNHTLTTASAVQRIRTLGPAFSSVRPRVTSKGSMVLFGSYPSREDPQAREDLNRLRNTGSRSGQRLFPRVMITYIEEERSALRSPHDLRNVRQQYGVNQTLYTLDVAVWLTPEEQPQEYARLKQEAEAHCRQLRAQGFEAYFHHNERARRSSVTVGVFGSNAIDVQTGIYSDEVMDFMRQFPVRYNNNQPLQVPIDRRHPSRGTRTQAPGLVEIPK